MCMYCCYVSFIINVLFIVMYLFIGRGLDSKLEKKVTFARLLDRVSSEISSGSEVDISRDPSTAIGAKREAKMQSGVAVGGLGVDSRSSSEVQLTTPGRGSRPSCMLL